MIQLTRSTPQLDIIRVLITIQHDARHNMSLQQIDYQNVRLFRNMVEYGDFGVEVDHAPGPLLLGVLGFALDFLAAHERLVDVYLAGEAEEAFDAFLEIVGARAFDDGEEESGSETISHLLRQQPPRPLNIQYDGLVGPHQVDLLHGRAVGDGRVDRAEGALPLEVAVREVVVVDEEHAVVAELAVAAVVDQAGHHPVIDNFNLRSNVY